MLDANLGGAGNRDSSCGEGSDEVFYRLSHPLGGGCGVVDSGLYKLGAAENDSESTVSTAMSTGVVSSTSTVTPSSMLTNAGDWTNLDQLDDKDSSQRNR